MTMTSFTGIGCMSGSSLDGLDLCYVEFTGDIETDIWGYRILKSKILHYSSAWEERLRNAAKLSGEELIKLHIEYGHYIGQVVKEYIDDEDLKDVDFIASHGHTIFHQPNLGYTFQLGDGETTSSYFRCPYVCNFRNKDVALGGQGAPLVPNGEKYLFSSNDICINLGGIANIGLKGEHGYDVCPCNFVTNRLATAHDKDNEFDTDGKIAASGKVIEDVLIKLEELHFYKLKPPKSLGTEWIEENVLPLLDQSKYSIPDLMRTFVEHVATRLRDSILQSKTLMPDKSLINVLVTGGGAFNITLVNLLKTKLKGTGVVLEPADDDTICFKEALIFAFLGLRSILGQENVYSAVTGSRTNSVCGSIHRPRTTGSVPTPTKFEKCYFEFKRLSVR